MSDVTRRASVSSGQQWWNGVSRHEGSALELDGYGAIGAAGGAALLSAVAADIRQKLELSDTTRLLELGAGAGAIAAGLAPHVRQLVAADFSAGMLQHARRLALPRAMFVGAEGARLPLATDSFDRALCYSVFNNFPDDVYAAEVLRELMRVVCPGGIVLIGQVPNADRKREWFAAYHARFGGAPQSRLRGLLGSARRQVRNAMNALRAGVGAQAPAELLLRYYDLGLFERVASEAGHRCELLLAYDLMQSPGGCATYDLRMDVRIHIARE